MSVRPYEEAQKLLCKVARCKHCGFSYGTHTSDEHCPVNNINTFGRYGHGPSKYFEEKVEYIVAEEMI